MIALGFYQRLEFVVIGCAGTPLGVEALQLRLLTARRHRSMALRTRLTEWAGA